MYHNEVFLRSSSRVEICHNEDVLPQIELSLLKVRIRPLSTGYLM